MQQTPMATIPTRPVLLARSADPHSDHGNLCGG